MGDASFSKEGVKTDSTTCVKFLIAPNQITLPFLAIPIGKRSRVRMQTLHSVHRRRFKANRVQCERKSVGVEEVVEIAQAKDYLINPKTEKRRSASAARRDALGHSFFRCMAVGHLRRASHPQTHQCAI